MADIIDLRGTPIARALTKFYDQGDGTYAEQVAALGYAVYLGFKIWKLAEPFLASVPAEKPPAAQAAPPAAVNRRRCVNCGQPLEEPAEFCAFCKHPAR